MYADFVLNGEAQGPIGQELQHNMRWDAGLRRPYRDERGRLFVTVNTGRKEFDKKTGSYKAVHEQIPLKELMGEGIYVPTNNATSLSKESWIQLDTIVLQSYRARLKAWADLAGSNTFTVPGMSKTILEHETISDSGEAIVDMDGMSEGRADSPLYQLEGLPLPITHSDFYFSERRLAASRSNGGQGLDSIQAANAGRRIAEMIEKTTLGVITGATYGGGSATPTYGRASTVAGYTNFSARLTKTNLTTPTGANPETTVAEVLAMLDQLYAVNSFGPFMLYYSTAWSQYMGNDYARLGGDNATMTLADRLRAIDDIADVRRLDYLTAAATGYAFTMILVEMKAEVARAVIGMNPTTMMWESIGGLRKNFKVMAIQVPQLRADYNGNCGILHARTAA